MDDSKRVVTNGNLAAPVSASPMRPTRGRQGSSTPTTGCCRERPAKKTLIESPSGVALPSSGVGRARPARAGVGVELTLDTQLQYESEQALAQAIESSQALSGTAIVMDVKTGQILSMANLVSTHPNAPASRHRARRHGTAGGVIPIGPKDASTRPRTTLR